MNTMQLTKVMCAVITADIVDYSKLSSEEEERVLITLHEIFKDNPVLRTNIDESRFTVTRGDNIQIELEDGKAALSVALLLKSSLNKIALNKGNRPCIDARIAIGLGAISGKRVKVNESTGDAYTFSGRTLDAMKRQKRTLAIKTDNPLVDGELETEFRLLEVILSGWTVHSAEVVYWTLQGFNEREIGNKLNITQSAVNQRKKTAGWIGIDPLLQRFKALVG